VSYYLHVTMNDKQHRVIYLCETLTRKSSP